MGDSEFALCVQGGQEEPRIRVIKLSLPSIDVLLGAEEEAIGKLWFLGCCGGGCAMIRGDTLMLNSSEGCNCLLIVLMFGMMLAFNNYFIFLLRFFVVCLLCFIVIT